MRTTLRSSGLLTLALLLSLASALIQRHGPDHGVYCALGKSAEGYDIYCPRPKLNGGWPAAFLFDRPGISVEDALFLVAVPRRGRLPLATLPGGCRLLPRAAGGLAQPSPVRA